ncbi:hypothetical protein [Aquimarina longa]|uniref:hypothetical protein n=1 Tax=Aquimarina longa TaxID=1080221 RepID=UPI000782F2ED|nr:hypothetical protein [Aquimarina longa]
MASKNSNDNGNLRSADTVICEGLTVIKNDKNTAYSIYKANETLQESKEIARGYKICCLNKAEESNDVYQEIMSGVTIKNAKKTEIIQKNIGEYIKKDDEIEKLIKDSSKLLNEMRVKLEDAHNAACAMSNCIKNKILPKSGKKTKDDKKVEIEQELKEITEKTKQLDEKGQNAFQSVVTIAGIQTFTNTMILKDFIAELSVAVKDFKECIDTNIKSTSEDVTTSRKELNVIVEELAQVACDKEMEHIKVQGLERVKHFVCEGEYEDECLDLCKDIRSCYDSDDGHKPKRKPRSRKQSTDQN